MTTAIKQNLTSGRYAVAVVGMRGWRQEAAIGDGITSATWALVTRCETMAEAQALADALNAEQPRVMPGSPSFPVYLAVDYKRNHFIGRQNSDRGRTRDCDRRIVEM